jgi:hypothetical protein
MVSKIKSRRAVALALIAAAASAAAGCGDDSESDDFAAEVGTVCEDAQAKFTEANEEVILRDPSFAKDYRKVNEPLYEEFLANLEAVEAPADKQEAYDAYIEATRKQSELILANPVDPVRAALEEKETEVTRELAALNEDAVSAGEEAGLPAACTAGTSQAAPEAEPAPAPSG